MQHSSQENGIIIEIEIYDEESPSPPSLKNVKFNQNRPINEEIDVFEGRGEGEGGFLSLISISVIIGEYMKTLCFKFHQNRAVNEEFYS